MQQFRWIVSQIGARQHYSVPRGFLYKNELRLFYTEAWCRFGAQLLSNHAPTRMRAFGKRWHPHLPADKVVSFTLPAMMSRNLVVPTARTTADLFDFYTRQGEWFARRVARHLERRELNPELDHFFGFDSGSLETLQMLKSRGVFTVVDQIDPARTEQEIVHEESRKWPGWEQLPGSIPESYFQRLEQEWALADLVLVNSQWSKSGLVRQGVPEDKVIVVPMAYEPERVYVRPNPRRDGPLRVLWLGTVNLRKGIQYLIEAARELADVKFIVAGRLEISEGAVRAAPKNVEFVGRVTRDRTASVYREADVFVLPTLSDGFAITQIEAMAHGLPVIATPNCGQVVDDGANGWIVPAGDARALGDAIARLNDDRGLLQAMSAAAIDKVGRYRLPSQSDEIEAEVLRRRGNGEAGDVTAAPGSTPPRP
jgi:glycosyltransferase involved in cell wall biosynthesis